MSNEEAVVSLEDDRYRAFAELSQYVTALVLYPIVSLIGMTCSVLCIIVLSQRQMLTSTNVYLIALAIADLMKLANDFLYFPATLLQMNGSKVGGSVFAHLYPYAFFLSQYSSGCAAWLTVVVAGERFLMVTQPNWSRYTLTVRKSRIVSATTFASVLLVTWPYLLRYETVCAQNSTANFTVSSPAGPYNSSFNSSDCTWKPVPSRLWSNSPLANYSKYYVQCQSCLKSLIPLLILIVLNIRIVMAVRETRANKKLASRNRVTVMLVMVILCYIVFTMPDSALSAMGWGYTEVTSNLRRGVREISDLLLAVNSSVNFFLYAVFNSVFRQNLLALCYESAAGAGTAEARQQTAGGGCGEGCSRSAAVTHNARRKAGETTACGSSTAAFNEERPPPRGSRRRHRQQQQQQHSWAPGLQECGDTSATTATTAVIESTSELLNPATSTDDVDDASIPLSLEVAGDAAGSGAILVGDFEFDREFNSEQRSFRQRMEQLHRHSHSHGRSQRQQQQLQASSNRRHCSSHRLYSRHRRQSNNGDMLNSLLHPDHVTGPRERSAEEEQEAGPVQVVVSLVVHHRDGDGSADEADARSSNEFCNG